MFLFMFWTQPETSFERFGVLEEFLGDNQFVMSSECYIFSFTCISKVSMDDYSVEIFVLLWCLRLVFKPEKVPKISFDLLWLRSVSPVQCAFSTRKLQLFLNDLFDLFFWFLPWFSWWLGDSLINKITPPWLTLTVSSLSEAVKRLSRIILHIFSLLPLFLQLYLDFITFF